MRLNLARPLVRRLLAEQARPTEREADRDGPLALAATTYLARRVAAELSAWAGRHAEAVSERAAAQIVGLTGTQREQRQEAH